MASKTANAVQHAKPARRTGLTKEDRLIHQLADRRQGIGHASVSSDLLRSRQAHVAGEYRQTSEYSSAHLIQEVITPRKGIAQRAVPFRSRSRCRVGDVPLFNPFQHLCRRQQVDPGGDQFNGQWQAVETSHQCRHI